MAETYSSLKVTINGLGDGKYLSLLDSADVVGGSGYEFVFDPNKPPSGIAKLSEFMTALVSGAVPGSAFLEKFGKWLFDCAFGGDNRSAYQTALALARKSKCRLRIGINVLAPDLLNVPWEYLHDGSGFVIKSGPAMVRLLEGVSATESSFAPFQNLLICMANPTKSEDFTAFDGETHLKNITESLKGIGGLAVTPLSHVKREQIGEALRNNAFDAFYFIGHGIHLNDGGGQLVCEREGWPEFLPADNLAAWIREAQSLRFVYLNACSTAVTSSANAIQGVAQRLMRDGRVCAVAAMQADVKQEPAQRMAESFFRGLSEGKSPEDAMLFSRTTADDLQTFGIPVLYSTPDGPAQFEKNKLSTFLSVTKDSSAALLLPQWIMGLPGQKGKAANLKGLDGEEYYFRGATFAVADVNAARSIANLLGEVLPVDKIEIRSNDEVANVRASHWFVFGSQSSGLLKGVLDLFKPEFEFDYKPAEAPGYWVIRDKTAGNCYEIRNPSNLDEAAFDETTDYGAIQKFTDNNSARVYFLIAGLGSRATEGCSYFLRDHWSDLLREFGNKDFAIIVKFPKNLGPQKGQRQERAKGSRPCSEIAKRIEPAKT